MDRMELAGIILEGDCVRLLVWSMGLGIVSHVHLIDGGGLAYSVIQHDGREYQLQDFEVELVCKA